MIPPLRLATAKNSYDVPYLREPSTIWDLRQDESHTAPQISKSKHCREKYSKNLMLFFMCAVLLRNLPKELQL